MHSGLGLNRVAQHHIKSMHLFLKSVLVFSMEPRNDLLSDRSDDEAYCLAEPEKQYAVFFSGRGDRSVTIDLASSNAVLHGRWLDVEQGHWAEQDLKAKGEACKLQAPEQGHWVAVLQSLQDSWYPSTDGGGYSLTAVDHRKLIQWILYQGQFGRD